MKVKFEVLGAGSTSFHSNKTGRDYQRMRLMGFVYDCDGEKIAATADMGFDAKCDTDPRSGETVVLDISSFSMRNAMSEIVFASLSHVATQSRELKR